MYKVKVIRDEIRLISRFMTSQTHYKTIAIYMLTNISRSNGNHEMKFGQLLEYNMRKSFPDSFLKN